MKSSAQIASTTSHILVANLAKSATLLLFFIFVSRLLGSDELGIYSLALAITTPFFALALLGARIARITGPSNLSNGAFERALVLSGLSATLLSLCMTLIFFPNVLVAVFLVSLFKWSDIFTELYAGVVQQSNKTGVLTPISLTGTVFVAGSSVLVLFLTQDLNSSLVTFALSGWIYALGYRKLSRETKLSVNRDGNLRAVFRIGLPLGFAGAIAALGSTFPQYQVALTLGESAVGTLAVYLYVYALADIFGAAYGQAWIPRLQESEAGELKQSFVLKVSVLSAAAMLPLTALGLTVFNWIAPLVFGNDFSLKLSDAVPLLIAIAILPYVHVIATALFVRMHYKRSMFVMFLATTVTVICTLTFVPPFGLTGAIYAIVAGLVSRGVASTLLLVRSEGKKVD